jgi:hypothetical protein
VRRLEPALTLLVVLAALVSRRRPARRFPPGVDADDLRAGYERSDASTGWIVFGGIALVVALGVVVFAATSFEAYVTGIPPTIEAPPDLVNRLNPAPTPPPPRLETAEGQELSAYRAAAERRLNSYAWIDRQAGVVSIPIDRAMDLVAQRGLPARQTFTAQDDGNHLPSSASSGRVAEPTLP